MKKILSGVILCLALVGMSSTIAFAASSSESSEYTSSTTLTMKSTPVGDWSKRVDVLGGYADTGVAHELVYNYFMHETIWHSSQIENTIDKNFSGVKANGIWANCALVDTGTATWRWWLNNR